MDAVLGVLGTVTGVIGPIFSIIGSSFSTVSSILTRFSTAVFMVGFLGLLFTFLWFFFRYLDKKKLTLPAVVFTFFFLVFLSGNVLLIAHDEQTRAAALTETAEQSVDSGSGAQTATAPADEGTV